MSDMPVLAMLRCATVIVQIILYSSGFDECLEKDGCKEIVGGQGLKSNKTLYVINESVTWETAFSRCFANSKMLNLENHKAVSLLNNLRQKPMYFLKQKLGSKYRITDMLLWIAVIVPPLADKLFLTNSCTHKSAQRLIKYYLYNDTVGMETTVRCILLNVSQIYVHSSKYLSIADCQERHPFVCEVSSNLPDYELANKSLALKEMPEGFKIKKANTSYENCRSGCRRNLYCFATEFTKGVQPTTKGCVQYHKRGLSDTESTVFYVSDSMLSTIVYIKTHPRLQLTMLDDLPSDSNVTLAEVCAIDVFSEDETSVLSTVLHQDENTVSSTDLSKNGGSSHLLCSCTNRNKRCTKAETSASIEMKIHILKNSLSIDRKSTSAHISRLQSAHDKRSSAKCIGYIGAVIIGVVIMTVVSCDIPYCQRFLRI